MTKVKNTLINYFNYICIDFISEKNHWKSHWCKRDSARSDLIKIILRSLCNKKEKEENSIRKINYIRICNIRNEKCSFEDICIHANAYKCNSNQLFAKLILPSWRLHQAIFFRASCYGRVKRHKRSKWKLIMSRVDVTLRERKSGGWMSRTSARHLRKCVCTKCHYAFGDNACHPQPAALY